jgi:catechol 2,3-dioxygenase-like lactoylglutathione lyase family enzyme
MKITEIAFTGHRVTDLPRARTFYEGVLNLKSAAEGEGWVEYDLKGSTFGLHTFGPPVDYGHGGCEIALEVEDFDEALTHLRSHGVELSSEPIDTGVCRMAFIKDPDGIPLTIHKRHPNRE